jgi:BirA family biotin operon repressor/biotin-[acetyl-CoA-carboxylase] ligase
VVGPILAAHRALAQRAGLEPLAWQLRGLPVCASTELELERWLRQRPPPANCSPGAAALRWPRAVIARRQRFGHGQQGRSWLSPPGGIWLSAALPWPADPTRAAAPGLAVLVALAAELARLGVPLRLKWPNDLMLITAAGPRKLAGLLPGLRLRAGVVRWARIGIGLNGSNPVPLGGGNLRGLPRARSSQLAVLAARVLLALDQAMLLASQPEAVRIQAEQLLLLPASPLALEGEAWWPLGLAGDGGLRLGHADGRLRTLRRF